MARKRELAIIRRFGISVPARFSISFTLCRPRRAGGSFTRSHHGCSTEQKIAFQARNAPLAQCPHRPRHCRRTHHGRNSPAPPHQPQRLLPWPPGHQAQVARLRRVFPAAEIRLPAALPPHSKGPALRLICVASGPSLFMEPAFYGAGGPLGTCSKSARECEKHGFGLPAALHVFTAPQGPSAVCTLQPIPSPELSPLTVQLNQNHQLRGLIDGMGQYGLAKSLGIGSLSAKTFIALYPGVAEYMQRTKEQAAAQGFVENLSGRRLYRPTSATKTPAPAPEPNAPPSTPPCKALHPTSPNAP